MDPLTQFKSNVRVLTVDHFIMAKGEMNGMCAGLIPQLEEEIMLGSTKTSDGGGSSDGAFVPLDIGSSQIKSSIQDSLKEQLRLWFMVPMTNELVGAVVTWASLVEMNADMHGPAAALTSKWVRAINELFDPVKMIAIPGDCPKCGCTPDDNGRLDDDGYVHVPPITVNKEMDHAKCAMCDYEWWGMDAVMQLGGSVQLMREAVPRNMQD